VIIQASQSKGTEEIYDILNGVPDRHGIHELPKQFSAADVNRHLEFDCARHLRLLSRGGFLEAVPRGTEKGVSEYTRLAAWPPPADFFGGTPIGAAYYIQKWFRYSLQDWISKRMRELECKDGVYSLEQWETIQGREDLDGRMYVSRAAGYSSDRSGVVKDHQGHTLAADGQMIRKPVDVSEMTLDWVQETNDVMFGDLSKADRMLLYLMYTRSMGMAFSHRRGTSEVTQAQSWMPTSHQHGGQDGHTGRRISSA
jgi:hypothetical protein